MAWAMLTNLLRKVCRPFLHECFEIAVWLYEGSEKCYKKFMIVWTTPFHNLKLTTCTEISDIGKIVST